MKTANKLINFCIYLTISTSIYLIIIHVGIKFFLINFSFKTLLFDFLLFTVFATAVYSLTSKLYKSVLLLSLITFELVMFNFLKISFFGDPIFIDDFLLYKELFQILSPFYLFLLILLIVINIFVIIYTINFKRFFLFKILLISSFLIIVIIISPAYIVKKVNKKYNYIFWDQKHNFENMGAFVYFFQSIYRYKFDTPVIPDKNSVDKALKNQKNISFNETNSFIKRNIYIVVIESLWDATKLLDAGLSRDCFDKKFRDLFIKENENYVLSPVFGGITANAEFEILCGQPSTFSNGLIFQTSIHNNVDCLPSILSKEGYITESWHPNSPTFFNRFNSYKRIGFNKMFFKKDFKFKDTNGPFLSDKELYNTVIEYNKSNKLPKLTYIMTISSHWGYPLNPKRKKIIKTSSKVKEVYNYVNSIYYSTREFMKFYYKIRKNDPNAIIVVLGDHLPYLGSNFKAYVESNILANSLSNFTPEMYFKAHMTPIIIIDGKRGKFDIGIKSMYEIPNILLDLLGYDKTNLVKLLKNKTSFIIRPFKGFNILKVGRKIVKCTNKSKKRYCLNANKWVHDVNIISLDLFVGNQYSMELFK